MFADLFGQLAAVTLVAFRNMAVLAAVFTLAAAFATACNKAPPWWRKPDLVTDICWAVAPQLLHRFASVLMLLLGISLFYGLSGEDAGRFFTEGRGPLAHLGFWPQVALYLLGNDLVMYLTHRMFHGARLWRFHAVHHSSEHLEWVSSSRFHPVDQVLHGVLADVVMLLLGIPLEVIAWLMPFSGSREPGLGFWAVPVCAGQPGVSPVAPHQRGAGRQQQLRRHLPAVRPDLRHVLYAGGKAAG